MSRLRIYTVHVNPSLSHPYEEAEFVAEGFNWRAFAFTVVWALYNRLWWHAIALFLYHAIMIQMYYSEALSHLGLCILGLGIRLFIGYEAQEWLRDRLKKQGYLTADIVTGDSSLRAEQRYFDRYFATHAETAAG